MSRIQKSVNVTQTVFNILTFKTENVSCKPTFNAPGRNSLKPIV